MRMKKILFGIATIFLIGSCIILYFKIYHEKKTFAFEMVNHEIIQQKIATNETMVVYYSSKDCKACNLFSPILEKESLKQNLRVQAIDADDKNNNSFANDYNLYYTPTLLIFKNGEVTRYEEAIDKDKLKSIFERVVK